MRHLTTFARLIVYASSFSFLIGFIANVLLDVLLAPGLLATAWTLAVTVSLFTTLRTVNRK